MNKAAIRPRWTQSIAVITDALAARSPLRQGVIVLGNFDGFHQGHQFLIQRARAIAGSDRAVGVMSVEPHPRQFFAPAAAAFRLTSPQQKRGLASANGLDFLFEPAFDRAFAGLGPREFIDDILVAGLGVHHVVVGADFHFGARRSGTTQTLLDLCPPRGVGVTVLPLQEGFSSTAAREAIAQGDMMAAARILGRPWLAELQGDRLSPLQIRPPAGVYLARVNGRRQMVRLDQAGRLTMPGPAPASIELLDRRR